MPQQTEQIWNDGGKSRDEQRSGINLENPERERCPTLQTARGGSRRKKSTDVVVGERGISLADGQTINSETGRSIGPRHWPTTKPSTPQLANLVGSKDWPETKPSTTQNLTGFTNYKLRRLPTTLLLKLILELLLYVDIIQINPASTTTANGS
jgi:hypothetical protein